MLHALPKHTEIQNKTNSNMYCEIVYGGEYQDYVFRNVTPCILVEAYICCGESPASQFRASIHCLLRRDVVWSGRKVDTFRKNLLTITSEYNVFQDLMTCSLVERYLKFGETSCIHLQRNLSPKMSLHMGRNKSTFRRKPLPLPSGYLLF
jgi:hypothetical protein